MTDTHLKLEEENELLLQSNEELNNKLKEALDVIEAIRKGNIDAIFITNRETAKIFVSKTADQSYRRFLENMSEGVLTLHPDGIIIYSNSRFAMMVEQSLEKVIGANVRDFIPSGFSNVFEQFFIVNPGNNSKVEMSIINSKGIQSWFSVSSNTLQLQDFIALNLVWTDITDEKTTAEELMRINESLKKAIAEQKISENRVVILNNKLKENNKTLEEANIELSTFAHIASHDLQEPLRKIITYSSILTNDYFNILDEQGQKYIENMQHASERMRDLINDILEYSQLSKKDFEYKPVNIQTIVKEVISNLEIVINESNAKIIIEKELPIIFANAIQMRQLFQNLLSNSLKFTKKGTPPEIIINYELVKGNEIEKMEEPKWKDKFCIFYIRDNGIGFQEEYIDKIFNIFQRLHNNTTYKGTGIGLAICKRIVDKHNGLITASSKPNIGSLFSITLPVRQTIDQKRKKKQFRVMSSEF